MASRSSAALQLVDHEAPRSSTSRTARKPASTHVRERLLAGKKLSNRDIQIEFSISNDHCVSDVAARLTREGHHVVKEKVIERNSNGRPVAKVYWHIEPGDQRLPKTMGPKATRPKRPARKRSSVSEQLRQRLMDGESLTSQQVASEFRVSRSLLGVVLAEMRQEGLTIEKEKIGGGRARFRLGAPAPGRPGKPLGSDSDAPEEAPDVPTKFSRKAIHTDLTRRFEAGERINAHTVMDEYGVSDIRFLASYLAVQRKKGWLFTRASTKTDKGWRTNYRLKWAKPKKKPAWVDEPPTEEPQNIVDLTDPEEVEFAQALEQFEGSPAPMVLPQLGTTLRVTLLAEGDEGEIVLGLKNGMASWMVTLRG